MGDVLYSGEYFPLRFVFEKFIMSLQKDEMGKEHTKKCMREAG